MNLLAAARPRGGWLLLGLLLLLWAAYLRPVALGGSAGYVLVSGSSMEPTLGADTLVLTIAQASYEPGDVVAFRIRAGRAGVTPLVIHRIVGGSAAEGYLTQGDNLTVHDPWRVTPADIVGVQVAAVPNAAPVLAFVRSPIFLASLAAGVAAYVVLGWPGRNRGRTSFSPPNSGSFGT